MVIASTRSTDRLVIVEDGSVDFGIGGEILARLAELGTLPKRVLRIGADPVPIPSVSSLELQVLPTMERIIRLVDRANLRVLP